MKLVFDRDNPNNMSVGGTITVEPSFSSMYPPYNIPSTSPYIKPYDLTPMSPNVAPIPSFTPATTIPGIGVYYTKREDIFFKILNLPRFDDKSIEEVWEASGKMEQMFKS
ncbi:hypothetical protein EVB94_219 [Rhizobium phage RHph_TM40]|nr:hypothetical protein EVB94_219 [Rhizobium phage RHph_TM40]QIG72053.1 hypothetical protein EVB95_219 [Rhizobium phage RHph_TM2_3B]QIG77806.1 hypothetical protein EVB64_219 [Rhizobium phage RHph_TM61]